MELITIVLAIVGSLAAAFGSALGAYRITFEKREEKSEKLPVSSEVLTKENLMKLNNLAVSLQSRLEKMESEKGGRFAEDLYTKPVASLLQARARLERDTERTNKNSRLNLIIGVGFSTFGIVILAIISFVLPVITGPTVMAESGIENLLPRFTISIIIQLIGFFFLRLHVASENNIFKIHNELTNLDLRIASINLSLLSDDSNRIELIRILSKEERNFILKKGERSAGAEEKSEYNEVKSSLDALLAKFERNREQ